MSKDDRIPIEDLENGPGSMRDFISRFDALHDEAKSYGFTLITVLMGNDPISNVEDKWIGYTNGMMATLGMLEYAKARMLADLTLSVYRDPEGDEE